MIVSLNLQAGLSFRNSVCDMVRYDSSVYQTPRDPYSSWGSFGGFYRVEGLGLYEDVLNLSSLHMASNFH